MQASEIVLYLLVSFSLSGCLILTTVLHFVCRQFRQEVQQLKSGVSDCEFNLLDQKIELNLKYDEQLVALAKAHNGLATQLTDLSGKVASLNNSVQGSKLNASKASQINNSSPIFPGRF